MHKRDRGLAPSSKSTRFAPAQRQLLRRISAAVRLLSTVYYAVFPARDSRRSLQADTESTVLALSAGSSTDVVGEACR